MLSEARQRQGLTWLTESEARKQYFFTSSLLLGASYAASRRLAFLSPPFFVSQERGVFLFLFLVCGDIFTFKGPGSFMHRRWRFIFCFGDLRFACLCLVLSA